MGLPLKTTLADCLPVCLSADAANLLLFRSSSSSLYQGRHRQQKIKAAVFHALSVDWVATTAVRCCVTPCYLRGLLSLPTGNTHTHTPFFGCITHTD